MFENIKLLKQISWKDLVVTVAFGIIIATGINYGVAWVRNIDSKVEATTVLVDKSVVKAFRVYGYRYDKEYLFVTMDAIKIRDCGSPVQFYIKYEQDGTFLKTEEIRTIQKDGSFGPPNILPVLDDWQRVGEWRIKPPFKATQFYVFLEHNCPIDLSEEAKTKLFESEYQQVAQETISRTYGPFELR